MLYYSGTLELSPARDKQVVKDILAKTGLISMPVPGFNGSVSMSVLGQGSAIDFWDYRSSAAISEQLEKVCFELRALGTNISGVLRFYGDDDGYVFVNEDGSVEVTDEEHGIIRCANTEDLVAELERRGRKVEKVEEGTQDTIVLFSVEELCKAVMLEMPCKSAKATLGVNLKTGKTYEALVRQSPLLYDPYIEVLFPDIPGFAYQHGALTEGVLAADFLSFQKRIQCEENGRIMYNQALPGNWYDQKTETLYIANRTAGKEINGKIFNGFLYCYLASDELSRLLDHGEEPVEYMLGNTPLGRMQRLPFEEALMLNTSAMIPLENSANTRVVASKVDQMKEPKSRARLVEYSYEVDIGGSTATGSIVVPDTASENDIKLAIMDDLCDVRYWIKEKED